MFFFSQKPQLPYKLPLICIFEVAEVDAVFRKPGTL